MKYLKTYEAMQEITFQEWLKNKPQDPLTTRINCSGSNLIDLDGIQEFKNLEILHCYDNQLQELNLEGLDKLEYLSCWNNQIKELNLEGLDNLEYLSCENNKLPYKDLEGWEKWSRENRPWHWEAEKFNM